MRALPFFLSAVVLLVARTASATPEFPDVIAEHLELASPPTCDLCHTGSQARGTVRTPFGVSMRSRGAQAYDNDSVRTALDALAAENKDSDGDGMGDITELKEGSNPNGSGDTVKPEYGCAVPHVPAGLGWEHAAALGTVLLLGLRRRGRAGGRRAMRRP